MTFESGKVESDPAVVFCPILHKRWDLFALFSNHMPVDLPGS